MTDPDGYSRRRLLAALAGSAVAGSGGCAGRNGDPDAVESSGSTADAPERPASGLAVRDVAFDAPSYGGTGAADARVTVQNWDRVERECWVALETVDVHGGTWGQRPATPEQVAVPAGGTADTTLTWDIEPGAPTGAYGAVASLWDRRTGGELAGQLGTRRVEHGFTLTAARPGAGTDACPIRGDALYVWGQASTVVTDTAARGEFLSTLDCLGTDLVFLSWGALPADIRENPDSAAVSGFVADCEAAGVDVSLLWGAERGLSGVERAATDLPALAAYDAGGVHIDLEPDGETPLPEFFDGYTAVLDDLADVGADISAFVAPWWVSVEPERAKAVRDHDTLEYTVIAGYQDQETECRVQFHTGLDGDPSHPYYAAFEFQGPSVVDDDVTFWQEGAGRAMDAMGSIAASPPAADRFRGVALHEYGSVTDDHYQ